MTRLTDNTREHMSRRLKFRIAVERAKLKKLKKLLDKDSDTNKYQLPPSEKRR